MKLVSQNIIESDDGKAKAVAWIKNVEILMQDKAMNYVRSFS